MESCLYTGEVMHARSAPKTHRFRYRLCRYGFDLDDLPALDRRLRLFGHNRPRPVAIHDADYLQPGPAPLGEKLRNLLREHGAAAPVERAVLVTAPRYFGYVFNPVSFFFCYLSGGVLGAVVACVRNTFGEMHVYALHEPCPPPAGFDVAYRAAKAFHVSPFFDRQGEYHFAFRDPRSGVLDALIHLRRDGHPALVARLRAQPQPLTDARLLLTFLRHPVRPTLTVPRILWQAAQLHWRRGLPVHTKPNPASPDTLRVAPPSRAQRWCRDAVCRALARLHTGRLELRLPDGGRQSLGADSAPACTLTVRNWRFFTRAAGGDIGLGESYMAGDWDTPEPAALLSLLIDNRDTLAERRLPLAGLVRALNALRHRLRPNSLPGSRRNIHDHYDLGNDFFQLFLDPSMSYSCALFAAPGQPLADAQRNKLQALVRKARIGPGDHVLEIGCGWGSFAIEAAHATGCRVTGLTISEAQLRLARERVAAAGLADRVRIELCDYRAAAGQYDRIVSIEMLEAVGHRYLGSFFAACDRLLTPDGLAVLQVITIPDQRYDEYRRGADFIRRHIFPGGHLPSLSALCQAMTSSSSLVVEDLANIGPHYAPTLRAWRGQLLANAERLRALGFDDAFRRKWEFYFAYCEAAFATRILNNLHLVLCRPGNRLLRTPPDGGRIEAGRTP
jgi:cyclopropane-fatty-acyl-phospholipid synthase